MNWPRVIAFLVIAAVMLCGYWASENKAANAGLPLVHTAALQVHKPLWLTPCGINPGNLSKWKDRRA